MNMHLCSLCYGTGIWHKNICAWYKRQEQHFWQYAVLHLCQSYGNESLYLEWNFVKICPQKSTRQQVRSGSVSVFYSETTWTVGIAQLTHHEVQGGGKNPETGGRGFFAPTADRVVS